MTGGWDDDRAPGPPPHRDDRLWVHPSEMRPVAAPSAPSRPRLRLPIGTALVAGATGALAMFVAVTVVGAPPVPTTVAPPTTVRAEVAAAYLATVEPASSVEVTLPDRRRVAALVVDDLGHLVVAADVADGTTLMVAAAGVPDGSASVVGRVGTALTVLLAPALRGTGPTAVAADVGTGGQLTVLRAGGEPMARARILASRWEGGCASLAEAQGALGGRLAVDRRGHAAGLVTSPDPDRSDRIISVVPAAVALDQAGRVLAGSRTTCT